jgi:predicted DCC family thiol-disulfide oxidoreductase YuxK
MIPISGNSQSPAPLVPPEPSAAASAAPYPLTVYFDGACPICRREISLMRRLDRRARLQLLDFSAPGFGEADCGLSCERLGAVLHARWSDGRLIEGVEVFRAMWTAVGFGWLVHVSRWPLVARLLVRGYAWFAKNRLRLTGRG